VCYQGEVAVYAGGTWQAVRDTGMVPGGKDWICLAVPGDDGRSLKLIGTYDPEARYAALDIVALNGGAFAARRDNPGTCPGDGWQLLARQGQRGVTGERGAKGDKGDKGDPGQAAPIIKSWRVDRARYLALPVMSDGREGPPLELRGLFEQFQNDT
jgi:hypothetical protein